MFMILFGVCFNFCGNNELFLASYGNFSEDGCKYCVYLYRCSASCLISLKRNESVRKVFILFFVWLQVCVAENKCSIYSAFFIPVVLGTHDTHICMYIHNGTMDMNDEGGMVNCTTETDETVSAVFDDNCILA